jgi:DNA-binding Xre family transcriptional regulator
MREINFQENVLKVLEHHGLSLRDSRAAEIAGMSQHNLKMIVERDRPTLKTVNRLASAWNIHVADLVCGPGLNDYRSYNGMPDIDLKIRHAAADKSLTIKEISERLGITRQALHSQRYGSPRISTIGRLARALGCSVKELLE